MAVSWTDSARSSRLRASAVIEQRSATTLVAVPPSMVPMLAVVSGSMRPSGMRAIARAAARMALRPTSGAMPAWAARPTKVASIRCSDGRRADHVADGPVWS